MKRRKISSVQQPEPFTSGVTRGMVREHALKMFHDKAVHHSMALEDWVLAEKYLVETMEADGFLSR